MVRPVACGYRLPLARRAFKMTTPPSAAPRDCQGPGGSASLVSCSPCVARFSDSHTAPSQGQPRLRDARGPADRRDHEAAAARALRRQGEAAYRQLPRPVLCLGPYLGRGGRGGGGLHGARLGSSIRATAGRRTSVELHVRWVHNGIYSTGACAKFLTGWLTKQCTYVHAGL